MTTRHAWTVLAAVGALGLAACAQDQVGPASAGDATAGALNASPSGSNSSGKPVQPAAPSSEAPQAPPGGK
jgi:hypothetical protein